MAVAAAVMVEWLLPRHAQQERVRRILSNPTSIASARPNKNTLQTYIAKHFLNSHICAFPMTYQVASSRLVIVLSEGGGDDVFEAAWVEGEHLGLDFLRVGRGKGRGLGKKWTAQRTYL